MFSGVTILLSLTIFLNTVSEIIPITSSSPLIGKQVVLSKVSNTMLILCSVILLCTYKFLQTERCLKLLLYTYQLLFLQNNFWSSGYCGVNIFQLDQRCFMVHGDKQTQNMEEIYTVYAFLGVAIMLSMTIFESIVASVCPVTGDTPILGQLPPGIFMGSLNYPGIVMGTLNYI